MSGFNTIGKPSMEIRMLIPRRGSLRDIPRRSLFGLNAANFLQAEMVGVILPVLDGFLRKSGWRYDSIGIATAVAGLGALLFQAPAGWLTDKVTRRRTLFAVTAIATGLCFVALPLVPRAPQWIDSLLFASDAAQCLSFRCSALWRSGSPDTSN